MKKQHTQKMTVRVTAQTAYNLERLMLMSGQNTPPAAPPISWFVKKCLPCGAETSKRRKRNEV